MSIHLVLKPFLCNEWCEVWCFRLDVSWWLQVSVHVDHRGSVPGWGIQCATVSREGQCQNVNQCERRPILVIIIIMSLKKSVLFTLILHLFSYLCLCVVAICPVPVFWGACICAGVSAQWSGVSADAAEIPKRRPSPEPHVPHHHRLLTGETVSALVPRTSSYS